MVSGLQDVQVAAADADVIRPRELLNLNILQT